MKTQVSFRSAKFPPYDGEEEQINPGLWGRRLAEYLVDRLAEKGIATDQIIQEDWGYFIPVRSERVKLAVCCGHQYGDDDEFLCFTDPARPVSKRFLRTIDATAELSRLTTALQEILAADPQITDITWTEPG